MKIGLLGFGTVGQGVYALAQCRQDLAVSRVLCRREPDLPSALVSHDFNDILSDETIDTVVEVMGGLHPAYEYVRAALERGKNVVTANKALMAAFFRDLVSLAGEKGVSLRCSAAVGGGIGWLPALERVRRIEPVTRIRGIMNGTCNYILDSMTGLSLSYAEALKNAQALGYAEADPTADVDGIDTRNKLVVSANIAFGVVLDGSSVPTAGIRHITAQDVAVFSARADGSNAFVQPTLFPLGQSEAAVPANYNLISLESDSLGCQSFFGQGAGRYPTAMNVLQDCADILENKRFYCGCGAPAAVSNEKEMLFYVRGAHVPDELVSQSWGSGVLTRPVAVGEFHRRMQTEHGAFFAAVQSD